MSQTPSIYSNLPYNPLSWPKRPSELALAHKLDEFIPDIYNYDRRELSEFLFHELRYHSGEEQTNARRAVRQQFMEQFHLSRVHSVSPSIPAKLAIFDVDDNLALLYAPVNAANAWTMGRLADRHHVPRKDLQNAVKGTQGEFGCHAPYELLHVVAQKTELPILSPDNIENWDIVSDWRYARLALTAEALFRDTIPTFRAIKEAGAKVYLSTASMPASLYERLHLWFGNDNIGLIDGIAVSRSIPGIPDVSVFATPEERKFGEQLRSSGKVMEVDLDRVKPHPEHVMVTLDHANKHRPSGSRAITPAECVLADDSAHALGSGRTAGMHTVLNIKPILADRSALEKHELWGCNRNWRDVEAFAAKYREKGEQDIPVSALREILQIFKFVPAFSSFDEAPVTPRHVKQHTSAPLVPLYF